MSAPRLENGYDLNTMKDLALLDERGVPVAHKPVLRQRSLSMPKSYFETSEVKQTKRPVKKVLKAKQKMQNIKPESKPKNNGVKHEINGNGQAIKSELEKSHEKNLEENNRMLMELGIIDEMGVPFSESEKKPKAKPIPVKSDVPKAPKREIKTYERPKTRGYFVVSDKFDDFYETFLENEKLIRNERKTSRPKSKSISIVAEYSSNKFQFNSEVFEPQPDPESVTFEQIDKLEFNESHLFKVLSDRITTIAIHPTNNSLIAFVGDKTGYISAFKCDNFDELTNQELGSYSLSCVHAHDTSINSLALGTNQPQFLYTSSFDNLVHQFDLIKGTNAQIFEFAAEKQSSSLSFSQLSINDSNLMYFGSQDGIFGQFDMRTGAPVHNYYIGTKRVYSASENPSNPNMVAIPCGRELFMADMRYFPENLETVMESHNNIFAANFSTKSGKHLAVSGYADFVATYDCSSGTAQLKSKIYHNNKTGRWLSKFRTTWAPNSDDYFIIGSLEEQRNINLYNSDLKLKKRLGHGDLTYVCSISDFHPSGKYLIGCNSSGKIQILSQ